MYRAGNLRRSYQIIRDSLVPRRTEWEPGQLAEVDPVALRLTAKMSSFCFHFCSAVTVFLAIIGPVLALPVLLPALGK